VKMIMNLWVLKNFLTSWGLSASQGPCIMELVGYTIIFKVFFLHNNWNDFKETTIYRVKSANSVARNNVMASISSVLVGYPLKIQRENFDNCCLQLVSRDNPSTL
jgi:hypothetical protein